MDAPAKRPARRGPERAHRVPGPTEGVVNDLNALHRSHPRPERSATTGSTCPTRRTARGIGGNPPRAACGLDSKGRQAGVAQTPSHQPLWGFPLATAPACAGLEEEGGGAPSPRRTGQGRSREPDRSRDIYSAGTPSTRQGRRLQPPLSGRRGGRPRRVREPDRSRDIYIAGNAYFDYTAALEPATTTPPPRREHHRSRFPLSSLLELFSV
jgi:hypothetical protein